MRQVTSVLCLAKQETLPPPGHLVSPLVCRGPWMSTVVLYCWCHSDSASVICILHFWHTCSLCRVELVVQFPARGSPQVLLCLFLVCCDCDTSYIESVHIQCQASIYTLRHVAGIHGDSSREPGLTSGLQGSVNVHRGALLLVPQWQCITYIKRPCRGTIYNVARSLTKTYVKRECRKIIAIF